MSALNTIKTILEGISGFENKVAYRAFPVGEAPALPYICYLSTDTDNFIADNKVYLEIQQIDIELYTKYKDEATENLIETALNSASIPWQKHEDYLDNQRCYEILYEVEV